jgi:hypothetical protein
MFGDMGLPADWGELLIEFVPAGETLLGFTGAEETKLFRAKRYLLGVTERTLIVVPTNSIATKRTGDAVVLGAAEITVSEASRVSYVFSGCGADYKLRSSEDASGEFDFELEGVDDATLVSEFLRQVAGQA